MYPEPGFTTATPVDDAVGVHGRRCRSPARRRAGSGARIRRSAGWCSRCRRMVSVRLSTPPLATAVASKPGVGLPPVMVTAGAVKPKPVSSTAMLVTHAGRDLSRRAGQRRGSHPRRGDRDGRGENVASARAGDGDGRDAARLRVDRGCRLRARPGIRDGGGDGGREGVGAVLRIDRETGVDAQGDCAACTWRRAGPDNSETSSHRVSTSTGIPSP